MKPLKRERVVRWVHPAWLDWAQAETYSSLPPLVLRNLIARRRLATRAGGKLIRRDSIDRLLLETILPGKI